MERNRTVTSTREAQGLEWPSIDFEQRSAHSDRIRIGSGYPLGIFSAGNGLRLWDEHLEAAPAMAKARHLGKTPQNPPQRTRQGRAYRMEKVFNRCLQRARSKRGPNPTDRAKTGTKRHLITYAQGIPVAICLSSANTHDIKEALASVEAIPSIQGPKGRLRKRPDSLRGDKGYDPADFRSELREKNIEPKIDKRRRNNHHLGKDRWLIERSFSWLNGFRRLRIHYERRSDVHEAFFYLGWVVRSSAPMLAYTGFVRRS